MAVLPGGVELLTAESGNVGEDSQEFDFELLIVTDPAQAPLDVTQLRDDPLTPKRGQRMPGVADPFLFIQEIEFDRIGHPNTHMWRAGVNTARLPSGQEDENPLNRPAKISSRTVIENRPTIWDRFGQRMTNTYGDAYTDITEPVALLEYVIEKNVEPSGGDTDSTGYPNWVHEYGGLTNSVPLTIRGITLPRRTVMVTDTDVADYELVTLGGDDIVYYPVTIKLRYDPWGYYVSRANKGFHYRYWYTEVASGGKTIRRETRLIANATKVGTAMQYATGTFKTEDGQPVTEPEWLDDLGRRTEPLPGFTDAAVVATAGSAFIDVPSGAFTAATEGNSAGVYGEDWWNPWIGTAVRVDGAGAGGRPLKAAISQIVSDTQVGLTIPAKTTPDSSPTTAVFQGTEMLVNQFEVGFEADLNDLPLT